MQLCDSKHCGRNREAEVNTRTTLSLSTGIRVAQRVEHWTCDQQVVGSNPTLGKTLGKFVHTYVPLSPSSITGYRPRGGDALWLGR